jgi:hypothetical protein
VATGEERQLTRLARFADDEHVEVSVLAPVTSLVAFLPDRALLVEKDGLTADASH